MQISLVYPIFKQLIKLAQKEKKNREKEKQYNKHIRSNGKAAKQKVEEQKKVERSSCFIWLFNNQNSSLFN